MRSEVSFHGGFFSPSVRHLRKEKAFVSREICHLNGFFCAAMSDICRDISASYCICVSTRSHPTVSGLSVISTPVASLIRSARRILTHSVFHPAYKLHTLFICCHTLCQSAAVFLIFSFSCLCSSSYISSDSVNSALTPLRS